MARKPTITDGPDFDDLDGQGGIVSAESEPEGGNGNAGGNSGSDYISPDSLTGDIGGIGDDYVRDENGNIKRNKDGSPRKRRGRKAGQRNGQSSKTSNTSVKNSIDALSQTFLVLHMGIAKLSDFKDFELDTKEADALAGATANVLEQFDIQPDPRFTAIAGLVSTAAMIYGPRIMLYNMQKTKKQKNSNKNESSNITAFTPTIIPQGN